MSQEKRQLEMKEELPSKKLRCVSPEITIIEDEDDDDLQEVAGPSHGGNPVEDKENVIEISHDSKIKQDEKEAEKIIKQQKKEAEKLEKERKKEEDRLKREKKKEEDRLQRERKKELERLEKEKKREEDRKKKEAEKLERERKKEEERLERERKKEEERLEKERRKEEEKLERERKKELEKVERDRKREEERLKKEEEKRMMEEEKARGQRKISSFFSANKSISPVKKVVPSPTVQEDEQSTYYQSKFLPFFQKRNVIMAAKSQLSEGALQEAIRNYDQLLSSNTPSCKQDAMNSFVPPKAAVQRTYVAPEDIVSALDSPNATEDTIYKMLQQLPPVKYLLFYENSKPPFVGTWGSKEHTQRQFPVLKPFDTAFTGYDYDYDSDLDWNGEEEEGEDIDDDEDEDEEEEEEEEDDEMGDFVDNDAKNKKRFMGPLVPVCQWNEPLTKDIFSDMGYERLHIDVQFSIDPTHNYFAKPVPADAVVTAHSSMDSTATASSETNVLTPQKAIIKDSTVVGQLLQFVEQNSQFSIGTLTELAKSKEEFKTFTKVLLKNTIQNISSYNKSSSRWEIKPEAKTPLTS